MFYQLNLLQNIECKNRFRAKSLRLTVETKIIYQGMLAHLREPGEYIDSHLTVFDKLVYLLQCVTINPASSLVTHVPGLEQTPRVDTFPGH